MVRLLNVHLSLTILWYVCVCKYMFAPEIFSKEAVTNMGLSDNSLEHDNI